jgi:ribulose-phosphate 3-epimerase
MAEIHPAILAKDEEEFLRKVDRVRAFGAPLHIDVMDGLFVPEKTWAPADRMHELLEGIPFEAHLMVANPEHLVPIWLACGASKVIFHAEATTRDSLICRATAEQCVDVGIALNPETPVSRVTSELKTYNRFMLMGVTPGRSGQPFQDIAIEKMKMLRNLRPSIIITVDGGVKPENARLLAEAGADILVVGSALTEAADPVEAYARFKEALNGAAK